MIPVEAVRMLVSTSEVLVEVDTRFDPRNYRGSGANASCFELLEVGRLVGVFSSETGLSLYSKGA